MQRSGEKSFCLPMVGAQPLALQGLTKLLPHLVAKFLLQSSGGFDFLLESLRATIDAAHA